MQERQWLEQEGLLSFLTSPGTAGKNTLENFRQPGSSCLAHAASGAAGRGACCTPLAAGHRSHVEEGLTSLLHGTRALSPDSELKGVTSSAGRKSQVLHPRVQTALIQLLTRITLKLEIFLSVMPVTLITPMAAHFQNTVLTLRAS